MDDNESEYYFIKIRIDSVECTNKSKKQKAPLKDSSIISISYEKQWISFWFNYPVASQHADNNKNCSHKDEIWKLTAKWKVSQLFHVWIQQFDARDFYVS